MRPKISRILPWEKFGSQCREKEFKVRLANYVRYEDRAENLQRIRQLDITGGEIRKERESERERALILERVHFYYPIEY